MANYNLKTPERPVGLLQAVEKLMYWAQVSLPAVYGEELTYAKEQGKMAEKINEVVEQLNVNTEWTEYLLNEGVENETVAYINELVQNGTLANLINNTLLTDINNEIKDYENRINSLVNSIVTPSPAGVYPTIQDIPESADKQRIYITSNNGHWVYWNGTAWTDGGVYQSTGIANRSIVLSNLKTYMSEHSFLYRGSININTTTKEITFSNILILNTLPLQPLNEILNGTLSYSSIRNDVLILYLTYNTETRQYEPRVGDYAYPVYSTYADIILGYYTKSTNVCHILCKCNGNFKLNGAPVSEAFSLVNNNNLTNLIYNSGIIYEGNINIQNNNSFEVKELCGLVVPNSYTTIQQISKKSLTNFIDGLNFLYLFYIEKGSGATVDLKVTNYANTSLFKQNVIPLFYYNTNLRKVFPLVRYTAGVITVNGGNVNIPEISDSDTSEHIITVKADGTGDFAGIRAALDSISDSSYDNRYIVKVYEGEYKLEDELTESEKTGGYIGPSVNNYVTVQGVGDRDKVIISLTLTTGNIDLSPLCMKRDGGLENITVKCTNGRYCIHDDYSTDNGIKYYRNVDNCVFIAIDCLANQAYGAGMHGNGIYKFNNCIFSTNRNQPAFGMHDTTKDGYSSPGSLEFNNCTMLTNGLQGVQFTSLGSEIRTNVVFNNCSINGILNQGYRTYSGTDFYFSGGGNDKGFNNIKKLESVLFNDEIKKGYPTTTITALKGVVRIGNQLKQYGEGNNINDLIGISLFSKNYSGQNELYYIQEGNVQLSLLGITGSIGDTLNLNVNGSVEINGSGEVVGRILQEGFASFKI